MAEVGGKRKNSAAMRWTENHDVILLREVLLKEPFKYKHGSTERGHIWEEIAETLNKIPEPNFIVTKRSVRDHFNTLSTNYKKRMRDEDKASGIAPEITEVDEALADLLERFDQADEEFKVQSENKKAKLEEDMTKAQEIRRKSMDALGETVPTDPSAKKTRNNGTDTVNYLREKMELDSELKKEEIELKKKEREDNRIQQRQMQEQQQSIIQQMSTSMQQQQQMSMVFMQQQAQQQQQQQALFMTLIEKLTKKD